MLLLYPKQYNTRAVFSHAFECLVTIQITSNVIYDGGLKDNKRLQMMGDNKITC